MYSPLRGAQRVKWWYRNNTRMRGKTLAVPVLKLTKVQPQPLADYQAYMALYTARVMPAVRAKYEAYLSGVPEDGTPKGPWAFAQEELKRMLREEPEEVQSEVEDYIERHAAGQLAPELDPAQLLVEGLEEAQKRVQEIQK